MTDTPEMAVSAYFDALNRSDADALAALFDDDGVVMADDAPTASGRQQIQSMFEAAFGAMSVAHQFHVDGTDQHGGLAAVLTHSEGTLTMLDAGTTIENAHRELFVLRNPGDGWRISQYMFNSVDNGAGSD